MTTTSSVTPNNKQENEKREETKDWSAFKRAQVRHRRRGDDPNRIEDLSEIIDFGCCNPDSDENIFPINLPKIDDDTNNNDAIKNNNVVYNGPMYGIKDYPGFLFAPQALSHSLQFLIAHRAVSEYCESPNATNIDQNKRKESEENNIHENMWELWKQQQQQRKNNKNGGSKKKKYKSFDKLTWATLGYHYDWTERAYHEGAKSPMSPLLESISMLFARTSLMITNSKSTSFVPSACIVNYYNVKSKMGGHRDDLELATDKPIVSISMGLPAIFLLGGKTKDDEKVIPILIRPGDVLCMGGDTRLNYHAMARVLPSTVSLPLPKNKSNEIPTKSHHQVCIETILKFSSQQKSEQDDTSCSTNENIVTKIPKEDEEALKRYLQHHRININIRQVYPE